MATTERIGTLLKKYINEHIPHKATNIFWQMFNGIEAMFDSLQYRLDISKRERNILTAQSVASLRSLAAQNGFSPTLKIPSTGVIKIAVTPKLFNRVGFPLYLPPYAVFTNRLTKLNYYYTGNLTIRLDKTESFITIVEGEIKNSSFISQGNTIERVYLQDANVANSSIAVEVNSQPFQEVPSFFDHENVNDNNLFVVKFSSDSQNPIIIYIKNTKLNDNISITYRLTNGELGNIPDVNYFETGSILDGNGNQVDASDDEISIVNVSGFNLGSNGSDLNALRAAIGYNHSSILLSDKISYQNFLSKFSTILIQSIKSTTSKTIKNLYLQQKQSINLATNNTQDIVDQYKSIISSKSYQLSSANKISLQHLLEEQEYALSSCYISDPVTCKFAFQLKFNSQQNIDLHKDALSKLIYIEFGKFLYDRFHSVNFEILFNDYMSENSVLFSYTIFNQLDEEEKIANSSAVTTAYIIKHDSYLPLLNGDFNVCDSQSNKFKLFFDINFVTV